MVEEIYGKKKNFEHVAQSYKLLICAVSILDLNQSEIKMSMYKPICKSASLKTLLLHDAGQYDDEDTKLLK